ncbi:MAG: hypothetical protein LBK53_04900 [Heliobacteriaceae bacterium]|jgi:hypothetical protein|nr:hypothetical protein [Heliobacteriaceae bacterium]
MVEQIRQNHVNNKNFSTAPVTKSIEAPVNINLSRASLKINDEFTKNPEIDYSKKLDEQTRTAIKNELTQKYSELQQELDKTKKGNGFIGKSWDWIKNKTGLGQGSNKTQKELDELKRQLDQLEKEPDKFEVVYKNITGNELTATELEKFNNGEMTVKAQKAVNSYKEGQEMAADITADVVSGIAAFGIYTAAVAAAPFTGGASIVVGVAAAAVTGAAIKTGVKYLDAKSGGREYDSVGRDLATGAFSGVLAPITGGLGGAAGKALATKLGVQAVKHLGKEVVAEGTKTTLKQGIKTALTNPAGYRYTGGTATNRTLSFVSEMSASGVIAGSVDNSFRAAIDGNNIGKAAVQGAIGGLLLSPVIGYGMKGIGHVTNKAGTVLNNKVTMSKVMPDGINTAFEQGNARNCPLLSVLDGMMHNPNTENLVKKAITKNIDGGYDVIIGNKIVKVTKESLTDEMLSNVTGIKIFEQAYKQLNDGKLEVSFAEAVAEKFGLNPVHIVKENLSDDVIKTIAQNQDNLVLSAGFEIGGQRHYLSIRNIDTEKGIVTLVDPQNTSKVIEKSLADFKKELISLDGGSLKKTDLPNSVRTEGEAGLHGKNGAAATTTSSLTIADVQKAKETLLSFYKEKYGCKTTDEINKLAADFPFLRFLIEPDEITLKMIRLLSEVNFFKGMKLTTEELLKTRGALSELAAGEKIDVSIFSSNPELRTKMYNLTTTRDSDQTAKKIINELKEIATTANVAETWVTGSNGFMTATLESAKNASRQGYNFEKVSIPENILNRKGIGKIEAKKFLNAGNHIASDEISTGIKKLDGEFAGWFEIKIKGSKARLAGQVENGVLIIKEYWPNGAHEGQKFERISLL